jgi:glycine/D-amino acid oxidase-like deaminating enzyme
MAEEVEAPHFGAAVFDPRGGQFNPLELVRGLKAAAERRGARVFEHSPATHIDMAAPSIVVHTGCGAIRCDKLVLASNGYTHTLEGLQSTEVPRLQAPLMVHASVTEPLSTGQWQALRWKRRCGINVMSELFYSFAPTADGRLLYVGGYYVHVPTGRALGAEVSRAFQRDGAQQLQAFFPPLSGLRTAQGWGGPISITLDGIPRLGVTKDPRILFACGCWGHGMPMGMRNGQTLAELALERRTAGTEMWFVRREKPLLPPSGLTTLAAKGMSALHRTAMRRVARRMQPPLILGPHQ